MFGATRKAKYSEYEDPSNLDNLSRKLAVDLRKHIRKLQAHPLLSSEWFEMVETLQHITNIAVMEQRLPKKEGGTLWDRDELTVRFVLEEGKLNMCLRALVEYAEKKQETSKFEGAVANSCQVHNIDAAQVTSSLVSFEQSMGMLLSCCFKSEETLQTCDLPVLVKHCSDLLSSLLGSEEAEALLATDKSQEHLCFSYLHTLATAMEKIGEDQVVNQLEQYKTVQLMIRLLYKLKPMLSSPLKEQGCEFLSLVFDTELFSTHKEQMLGDDECKSQLVALEEIYLKEAKEEYQSRKPIQNLLDCINQLQRQGVKPAV
ncbi:hypothetical protein CYMTET_6526 [Cymbomonas tetramitiformis]|uniref:Uncharacterized protein n=1 Tax=Cymbomonas tetramitiformis TaxID=36881 RepID=A0AAE0GX19_9CHLO|nr:hypothetical protein CYMTET_6526 [Cymbomonas tetramitiformis]